IPRKLHLHARSLDIAHPDGGRLFLEAELPPHMKTSWKLLGFDERDAKDAFAGLEE
ncbi:MAG TPA: RluA family pseudouridine synthase, partial [Rhodobiaceae bacterium]|nr:RluA family pseudouridine synthase [Rhodobiaceae bacterium]